VTLAITLALRIYRLQYKEHNKRIAAKEQEQRIYEEKVQLLINISHELRTPLTLIMAPLKRLIKNTDAQDSSHSTLMRIYRQSKRMKNLLNMVLDLRKMEEGQNRLNIEQTNLNLWLQESLGDLISEEQAENISITTDFDSQIGSIGIDRQKFDIILMNIMINAIKHSSTGDIITLRTRLSEDGSRVRISISDEGPGLGNVDISKLFNRFYQSNSEKYGSGIGLAYSKILVDLHGGKIGAYSNEIKGATFWWEIPVIEGEQSADTPARAYINEILVDNRYAAQTTEKEEFSTLPLTLMLVDDSQDLLDFMKEAMQSDFSKIITRTGGREALKTITSGKVPDIIVSDINMPEGDGYSLCRELKSNEKYNHIPVILLTAQGEENTQSESYRVGAEGFLAKPFEIETLLELAKGILKRKSEIKKKYLDKSEHTKEHFGSSDEGFILRFNQIISKHIGDPALDQQMICNELGVSRALLYNKMRAITGAGAKEYITKIRIEKAKSLMETTTLPIVDIAEMTGFTSQSYFSTAFKNQTGMSPSQYKRELKESH
jgi:CheY-like chemotaxis protein/nitrogen-specific signal transduction histidine kinase